jgi:hypothetical protein
MVLSLFHAKNKHYNQQHIKVLTNSGVNSREIVIKIYAYFNEIKPTIAYLGSNYKSFKQTKKIISKNEYNNFSSGGDW